MMQVLSESIVCSLQNWRRTRQYEGSLAIRQEGFTEDWGDRSANCSPEEEESTRSTESPSESNDVFELVQYRPAWTEQLILKLCCFRFRLLNSRYAVTEITGELPYLRDGTAIAGGHQDILSYLSLRHGSFHDLFPSKLTKQQHYESDLLVSWIKQQLLSPSAALLQRKTSAKPPGNWWITSLQHWAEAVLWNSYGMSEEQVMQKTKAAYKVLDDRLAGRSFLLGTAQPVYVDCLLWGHLMQAICHEDLILVLHDFPNLVSFLQNIYSRYHFGSATGELNEWNVEENALNIFMNDFSGWPFGSDHQIFKIAVDQAHRLRHKQESMEKPDPMVTLHRWRRDGPMMPPSKALGKEPPSKFHDDVWLVSVTAATIVLLFGFGLPESS